MITSSIRKLVDNEKGYMDRRIYTDKDIYNQELEQVFGRAWLFVGHETQIPKANDFVAAYMGEDPILVTRDSKNKLHAFLNMCRHRGNRICRADAGNAPSFMCTYHGWTFATDGKLVGVPGYKEAYFEELDRSQWGLVEAAQIDSYKGWVYATWDKSAPSLIDYLGDMTWYMDETLDRVEGGTEFIGGVHRFVIPANWKLGADNFAGDGYHTYLTHGSLRAIRQQASGAQPFLQGQTYGQGGYAASPGNGHGIVRVNNPAQPAVGTRPPTDVISKYRVDTQAEMLKRLGVERAEKGVGTFTVFPNFSNHVFVRTWHPRGPEKTEVWSYHMVEKNAPQAVKDALRKAHTFAMGPSGNMDQDDMNNWVQCTQSGKTFMGKSVPINQQLGVNRTVSVEGWPGYMNACPSEQNQREMYGMWAKMMDAASWADIKLEPRTTK